MERGDEPMTLQKNRPEEFNTALADRITALQELIQSLRVELHEEVTKFKRELQSLMDMIYVDNYTSHPFTSASRGELYLASSGVQSRCTLSQLQPSRRPSMTNLNCLNFQRQYQEVEKLCEMELDRMKQNISNMAGPAPRCAPKFKVNLCADGSYPEVGGYLDTLKPTRDIASARTAVGRSKMPAYPLVDAESNLHSDDAPLVGKVNKKSQRSIVDEILTKTAREGRKDEGEKEHNKEIKVNNEVRGEENKDGKGEKAEELISDEDSERV